MTIHLETKPTVIVPHNGALPNQALTQLFSKCSDCLCHYWINECKRKFGILHFILAFESNLTSEDAVVV